MSKEQPQPYHSPEEIFGFTEHEKLHDQVSHKRFTKILSDPQTNIHEIQLSQNSFGEYLFVTVSRELDEQRRAVTFFGLGYHQYREQWITKRWEWYASHETANLLNKQISLEEAQELIETQRTEIEEEMSVEAPSQSAILFSMFAEVLDEDGALSELEDMGWTLGGFDEENLNGIE